jgi:hypothetical protein
MERAQWELDATAAVAVREKSASLIGKVTRGTDAARLLYYLYGPGKANEHADPHLVAGFGDPGELEPELRPGGLRDLRRLTALLTQPLVALGRPGYAKPVWHCSVRAAPDDRLLSDEEWGQVAAQIMERTGLAPEPDWLAVRWVAVRHAADHIHIVATLARQDGARPRIWNDFYRVREASQAAERDLSLHRTAPADRTAARRPTRAETEQAARRGWAEPPRVALRREVAAAAAGASSEQEFFALLAQAGVAVRQRRSTVNPGEVTGYAVGLPHNAAKHGGIIWYGGGKLAADLTLPKLRLRWDQPQHRTTGQPGTLRLTGHERDAIYTPAARQAASATRRIRHCSVADPAGAADASWAAADTLRMAARALRSPALHRAANVYDRAACAPYGRIPRRTREGDQLRNAARSLARAARLMGDPGPAPLQLVAALADLAIAVAELRQAQQHAAQAAAARRASEHLHAFLIGARSRVPRRPHPARPASGRQPSAADLARSDFPGPLTLPPQSGETGWAPPTSSGTRPRRASRPPRRAGPAP